MSKNRNKGNKAKPVTAGKDVSNDPLDYTVTDLVLKLRESDQSYRSVSLAEHFEKQAESLYPNLARETITVPAIHVHKTTTGKKTDSSNTLGYYTVKKPQDSDARGDRAHVVVFHALYDVSEQLKQRGLVPLFVINSYQYDSYLSRLKARWDKETAPTTTQTPTETETATEAGSQQPEALSEAPCEHEESSKSFPLSMPHESGEERGEVDMLVLQPGCVTFIQAKSMGDNFHHWSEAQLLDKDEKILKEVRDAFGQLDRDYHVFSVCMTEFYQEFKVVKVAAFPNLTLKQIQDADQKFPSVLRDAGYSLDLTHHKLMCQEHMPVRNGNSGDVSSLVAWWLEHVEGKSEDYRSYCEVGECECDQQPMEGLKTLKNVIGRYLGIMSIVSINCRTAAKGSYVEVRRFSQAVKYVADRFSSITLTLEQVDIVNNDVRRGFLIGPPGSGKTVVLAIKARSWIIQEKNFVVIINMYRGASGRAIGKQTINTLCMHPNKDRQKKLQAQCYEVCVDVNTFDEAKKRQCVQEVLSHFKLPDAKRHRVMFLVDETYVMSYWDKVFAMLENDFRDSPVWLAGLYGNMPAGFTPMSLNKVIRCPPMIQMLLKEVDWVPDRAKCYEPLENCATAGTYVFAIRHRYHSQPALRITDCRDCAEDIMKLLLDKFDIRPQGTSESQPEDLKKNSLVCRDVCFLINLPRKLYGSANPYLDTTKHQYEQYMRSLEECQLFRSLRQQGYPVKLHVDLPCRDLVGDVRGQEEGSPADHVIKACWVFSFQGLELPVVFYLPGDPAMPSDLELNAMAEEERAVLTDPLKNIPCPGYRTTTTTTGAPATTTQSSDDADVAVVTTNVGTQSQSTSSNSISETNRSVGGNVPIAALNQKQTESSSSPSPQFVGASGGEHKKGKAAHQKVEGTAGRGRGGGVEEGLGRGFNAGEKRGSVASIHCDDARYKSEDVARLTRWDRSVLFISASRSTAQLVLVTP